MKTTELDAMRQLISEQMERIADLQDKLTIKTLENLKGQSVLDDAREEIKQQQAVIDTARAYMAQQHPANLHALIAVLAALPQPAKGKP
jgi:hypothetical protein